MADQGSILIVDDDISHRRTLSSILVGLLDEIQATKRRTG